MGLYVPIEPDNLVQIQFHFNEDSVTRILFKNVFFVLQRITMLYWLNSVMTDLVLFIIFR